MGSLQHVEEYYILEVSKLDEPLFNKKEGRDCHNCGYRTTIPGSAHSRCNRKFIMLAPCSVGGEKGYLMLKDELVHERAEDPSKEGVAVIIKMTKWSAKFPLNFDPVWVEACFGWVEKGKEDRTLFFKPSALVEMFAILGG